MKLRLSGLLVLLSASVAFGAMTNTDVPPTLTPAGSGVEAPAGTWTITGAGADIWGTTDEFHFLYQTPIVSGDFAISCHIVSLAGGEPTWAKAGLMARTQRVGAPPDFAGPESYAFVCVTNSAGACLQYRDGVGAGANDSQDEALGTRWAGSPNNKYLKLVRTGDEFFAYAGPAPNIWVSNLGSKTLGTLAGADMFVGVALTSHLGGTLSTAVVDSVNFADTGVSANAVTDLTCTVNGSNVDLAWTNGGTYSKVEIWRMDLSNNFAKVSDLAGTATSYTDTPGNGIWTYYVTAVEGALYTAPAANCGATISIAGAGFIDGRGFFRSWLTLGPLSKAGGCQPPEWLQEYLGDEATVLPKDGDVTSNFTGLVTAVQGPTANGQNPNATSGEAEWWLYNCPTDTIDHDTLCGQGVDEHLFYHVTYLTNSGAARPVMVGVGHDDAIVVVLDNSIVFSNPTCAGYGASGEIQRRGLFMLPTGEHRLMVKVFDGGGGSGFRLRLEELNGTPITAGISIKVIPGIATVPAALAGPSGLACTATGTTVNLTWTNPAGGYDQIAVVRQDMNGVRTQIASPAGTATSATDSPAPLGGNTYWVAARKGSASCAAATCIVNVGEKGVIDAQGFFRTWLKFGPVADAAGCNTPRADAIRDYITDGVTTEANVLPEVGDVLAPTAAGVLGPFAASQIGPDINPDAPDAGVWYLWTDPDDTIDDNAIYGSDPNNCNSYNIIYINNKRAVPRALVGACHSDDSIAVALNNSYYWAPNAGACRGVGGAGAIADRFPFLLPPGESRLLVKVFEQGGGFAFRFRLENADGTPVTEAQDIELKTKPTMTSVPAAPTATIARVLNTMVVGTEAAVTLTVTGPNIDLYEDVPANFTITNTGGGTATGQQIKWTNVTGAITYRARPTAEGGVFSGYGQEVAGKSWVVTTGNRVPVFPQQVAGWYHVDIRDTGHTPGCTSSVTVAADAMTIETCLGRDIWDAADEGHIVWKEIDANKIYSITARLDTFTPYDPALGQTAMEWSKAGIMVRNSAAQGSPYVYAMIRSDLTGAVPDPAWQWRDASDTGAAHDDAWYGANQNRALPQWIRLVYNKGECTGYFAPDEGGLPGDWLETAKHTLNTEGQATILGGFAVTTHVANPFDPIVAEFSEVELVELQGGLTNLTAVFAGANVNLAWTNAGTLSGISISRTFLPDPGGTGVQVIADLPGTATSYTDSTVPAGAIVVVYTVTPSTQGIPLGGVSVSATRTGYVVFQEGSSPTPAYDGCQDAHIIYYRSNQNEWNTGANDFIEEGGWDASGHGDHKETLIQFAMPGVTNVTEATLWLYYAYNRNTGVTSTDHTAYAYPVLKAWNEGAGTGIDGRIALDGEVTWQSAQRGSLAWWDWDGTDQCVGSAVVLPYHDAADTSTTRAGGAYGTADIDIAKGVPSDFQYGAIPDTWVSWDITAIAQGWAANPASNNGVKISQGTTNSPCDDYVVGGYDFVSSNNVALSALRPVLIVRTEGVSTVRVWMGNANGDATVNIADAVTILGYLFGKPPKPPIPCFKAADTNDDNTLNVADAIDILTFLFGAQTNPSKPMTGPDGSSISSAACRPYPASDIPATIIGQPGCATPCP